MNSLWKRYGKSWEDPFLEVIKVDWIISLFLKNEEIMKSLFVVWIWMWILFLIFFIFQKKTDIKKVPNRYHFPNLVITSKYVKLHPNTSNCIKTAYSTKSLIGINKFLTLSEDLFEFLKERHKMVLILKCDKVPQESLALTNKVFVHPEDYAKLRKEIPETFTEGPFVQIEDFIFTFE